MKKYTNFEPISKLVVVKEQVYPKYGKSTTDPTYYEPAATRIANMYKSSGLKLEGVYDYSKKSDVDKFNEDNFEANIKNAMVDPHFNKTLLPEEVSQITNNLGFEVEKTLDKKKIDSKDKSDRLIEAIETSKLINKVSENTQTSE